MARTQDRLSGEWSVEWRVEWSGEWNGVEWRVECSGVENEVGSEVGFVDGWQSSRALQGRLRSDGSKVDETVKRVPYG
jgi:hypothetical protein